MVDSPTPISLDTNTNSDSGISLDTGDNQNYLLSPDLITQRATKYAYAVSNTPAAKSKEDLQTAIAQGKESDVRQEAASSINSDLTNSRYNLLTQTMANKQGPLTPEDMKNVDTASGFNFPYAYPRDPNSIFEQNFGKQYVSELDNFATKLSDTNFWNYGQMVARNDIEAAKIFGDVTTAQQQYLITKQQDADAKIKDQTSIGYGVDFGKSAFPILNPYYEAKLRGNVPGTGFFAGGLLGENLEQQRLALHAMPFEQFTATVDSVYNKLSADNPQIAAQWLAYMKGQSAFDRVLNNVNTVGHLLDVPIIFQVGKVAFSKAGLISQLRTGTTTALKAVSTPEAAQAEIFAGVGDLRSAGRVNANNVLTGKIDGSLTPVEEAVRTLPDNLNMFKTNIQATTELSTTHQNILLSETNGTIYNGLKTLNDTLRPTRVDLENLTADVLDKIDAKTIRKYAGDNDSILRTSDPIRNPISTGWYKTLWLGNDAGTFFENIHEAADRIIQKGFRVTYTPEQLADIDARIATIKSELGITAQENIQNLEKVHLKSSIRAEDIRNQYGKDSAAYSEALAEAESNRGALEQAKRGKGYLETGPDMHADVHELNYYHSLPDTLKYLQDKRAAVSKPGGVLIKQQGLAFYGEFNVPVKETDRLVGDLVMNPKDPLQVSPKSWTRFIPYFNYARTAEDTFSEAASANRKAALYPQAAFNAMVQKDGKILSDFQRGIMKYDNVTGELNPFWKRGIPGIRGILNRKSIKQFYEVLDYSQKEKDPITKDEGWWMTPSELHHHYLTTYERPPTFAETRAYEAAKRWDEMQRWFTQVSTLRNQEMNGNQLHQLTVKAPDGTLLKSPEFVGAIKDTFPKSRGTILIMGDDLKGSAVREFVDEEATKAAIKSTKDAKVKDLGRTALKEKEGWRDLTRKGSHRLIQVDKPEDFPFKDMGIKDGDNLIQFVLSPNVETSALRWDSIPRTGGGRFVYDYTHWLKQPIMKYEAGRSIYLGDRTIAPVGYKPLGEDVAKKANVVRRLINAGKDDEAKAAFVHNGLEGAFEPWGKFRAKFERFKDEEGNWHEPMYNKEEDFEVVPKNKAIIDMHKKLETKYGPEGPDKWRNTWRNGITENNPARNFQVQFTQERDAQGLQAIENVGTYDNPVYKRTPAQKIDPLTMMNRGMRSTVNSLFMDDYKSYAVNSFLREVADKLKASDSEIWSSPYATFRTLTPNDFKPGIPKVDVLSYMANHYKINQLVGTPTVLDSFVHEIAQHLADATYKVAGPTAASHVVPSWLLPKLRDPFAFMRSVTFNAYLGLFSVPQMLVQSMNYVNMFAIAPRHAVVGTYGAYLHYLSRFTKDPEILNHIDNLATKMRIPGLPVYKPGEFLEAMKEFDNTGFRHVGAEQGMMDNMYRNNIIQRGSDKFLEWGRKPFQWGEMNSRIGAWYIAMKEFRDKIPGGALTQADRRSILQRADFLYGNMSVASHSALNSGILSMPTQFYMYTARLAEIFWSGSRLGGTLAERNLARLRLVAVNTAMFGLPMAAGTAGLPVSDWLREQFLESTAGQNLLNPVSLARKAIGNTDPYVVGKNYIQTLLNEGVLAGLGHAITDKWLNVGPREGLQGLTPLLMQDPSFFKIAGGASASLTMNTFNNGVYPLMFQLFHGNFNYLKLDNLLDVFKEAQIVNSASSFWTAWGTGKWINKNSDYISDTSKAMAATMFFSGLRETGQVDIWHKEQDIKARDETQKMGLKYFSTQMNRAIIASANGDKENALAFRDNAISWLAATDFPPEKIGQAIIRAFKGAENLIDRVDKEFYITKVPPAKRDAMKKAFEYVYQHKGQ